MSIRNWDSPGAWTTNFSGDDARLLRGPADAVDDLLGDALPPHRRTRIPVGRHAVGHGDGPGQRTVLAAEQGVVPPLLAGDAAVTVGVTEGHQHLAVHRISVVPHDSEIGPGDREPLDRLVGAVRAGHPADDRRAGRRARGRLGRRSGGRLWRRGGRSRLGCVRDRLGATGVGRRDDRCPLPDLPGVRDQGLEDGQWQLSEPRQRSLVVGPHGLVTDGPVERGELGRIGDLESLMCQGLRGRGRAFTGFGRCRGRHADGDDEPDCGRRGHRRSTPRTSRHVTPSQYGTSTRRHHSLK